MGREMNAKEFKDRFLELECDEEDRTQQPVAGFYISSDKVLGIACHEDKHSRFMSFGRFKLKRGRHQKVVKFASDLYFYPNKLYRAMHVLHRRSKFEIGLFNMNNGEIFAMREGDNIVLIAPAIFDGEATDCLSFQDIVIHGRKSFFEKWETWARILHGRRS